MNIKNKINPIIIGASLISVANGAMVYTQTSGGVGSANTVFAVTNSATPGFSATLTATHPTDAISSVSDGAAIEIRYLERIVGDLSYSLTGVTGVPSGSNLSSSLEVVNVIPNNFLSSTVPLTVISGGSFVFDGSGSEAAGTPISAGTWNPSQGGVHDSNGVAPGLILDGLPTLTDNGNPSNTGTVYFSRPTLEFTQVPEPSSSLLFGIAAIGLVGRRNRNS